MILRACRVETDSHARCDMPYFHGITQHQPSPKQNRLNATRSNQSKYIEQKDQTLIFKYICLLKSQFSAANLWHLFGFVIASIFTCVGYFVENVPFSVAYVPFIFIISAQTRQQKFWLSAGHFTWSIMICCWGLIQLGHSEVLVILAGVFVVFVISMITARFGVWFIAIITTLIPFFPASPLLVTGTLLTGLGTWGLFLLPAIVFAIERLSQPSVRFAFVISFVSLQAILGPLNSSAYQVPQTTKYQEIDLSKITAITRIGQWDQMTSHIPENATVILGENIFDATDNAAISYWCRIVTAKTAIAYIGVRNTDEAGEVWVFDETNCPNPKPVYHVRIGVPGITGGILPDMANWYQSTLPAPQAQWLICFEAFSILSWDRIAHFNPKQVFVLSNDVWTDPLPTARLRRKVGNEFSKLYGIDVMFADTGQNLLISTAKEPS